MKNQILDIFRKQLGDTNLSLESEYKAHPKWSSLRALIIVNDIELRTHVLLSARELSLSRSIRSLTEEIYKQAHLLSTKQ